MSRMSRRTFVKAMSAAGALEYSRLSGWVCAIAEPARSAAGAARAGYRPGRIANEYTLFLPGERKALATAPAVRSITREGVTVAGGRVLHHGDEVDGWQLLAVADMNGSPTVVFEKHVTHRGAIAYVTVDGGAIANVPKYVGQLESIRPRQIANGGAKLVRAGHFVPGPDTTGDFILNSTDDPCYENVAALGEEYTGWTLVANEDGGPRRSLFLDEAGKSRQIHRADDTAWAPDRGRSRFRPFRPAHRQ